MNILIISTSYPPLNIVSSYRIYSFAKYWSENGNKVIVLTTKKYKRDGDLSFVKTDENIDVVEVGYADTYLEKPQQVNNTSKKSNLKNYLFKLLVPIKHYLEKKLNINYDRRSLWVRPAIVEGKKIIRDKNIQIIVSTYGPKGPHIVASNLKKSNPYIFWVADYRDLWSGNHLVKRGVLKNYYLQRYFEKRILRMANIIFTVSGPLKEYLAALHHKPTFVIENGYFSEDIGQIEGIASNNDLIVFAYTGLIYPGKRDPSPFFKALKELENERNDDIAKVKVRFYGSPGNVNKLAIKHGVEKYVEIYGSVTREQSLKVQRNADALLFLETSPHEEKDLSANGVLTGKIFEYLISGTEIIGIGINENTLTGRLITDSKSGIVCGHDVDLIKLKILNILKNGKTLIKPDHNLIKQYRRDKLAFKAIDIIKNECSKSNIS